MLIEFTTEWGIWRAGQVVQWDGTGSADVLIQRGIAKPATVITLPPETPPGKPQVKGKRGAR